MFRFDFKSKHFYNYCILASILTVVCIVGKIMIIYYIGSFFKAINFLDSVSHINSVVNSVR